MAPLCLIAVTWKSCFWKGLLLSKKKKNTKQIHKKYKEEKIYKMQSQKSRNERAMGNHCCICLLGLGTSGNAAGVQVIAPVSVFPCQLRAGLPLALETMDG